jgi:hypothetical protein
MYERIKNYGTRTTPAIIVCHRDLAHSMLLHVFEFS